MKIMPIDIANKKFSRTMRGYNTTEVDALLKDVASEIEGLLTEQNKLQERVERMEAETARYRDMEGTLKDAIVLAQKTSDDLLANARREADLIMRESKESTAHELAKTKSELETLQQTKARFVLEFRSMLTSYLEMVKGE